MSGVRRFDEVYGPDVATITSVGDTLTAVTLIGSNSNRRLVEFVNTSTGTLYLSKGLDTPSTTKFTAKLNSDDYYATDFRGQINGIWSLVSGGEVMITETE